MSTPTQLRVSQAALSKTTNPRPLSAEGRYRSTEKAQKLHHCITSSCNRYKKSFKGNNLICKRKTFKFELALKPTRRKKKDHF